MKRSLLLILLLLCGIYLILNMKGDVSDAENPEINPLEDYEDYPLYSDSVDVGL